MPSGWQRFTDPDRISEWKNLRIPKHWAQVDPGGKWEICQGMGIRAVVVDQGKEKNMSAAKQAVNRWEERNS